MHPFVHLLSSNSQVFHTSGIISSKPAVFLLLIFLGTESSSSLVHYPTLMSNCLLIILVIGSCVIFREFPRKFSKCCYHRYIRSCCLLVFSSAFAVLFLQHTYRLPCDLRLSIFNRVSHRIDLILYVFAFFFLVYVSLFICAFYVSVHWYWFGSFYCIWKRFSRLHTFFELLMSLMVL